VQRFAGQGGVGGEFGGCDVAQRLQARGQAQQHHAQIARKGQQHLADVFVLAGFELAGGGALGAAGVGRAGAL